MFCFPITGYPTTSSSLLEPTCSSCPATVAPDLSPLLLNDLRVITLMHRTLGIMFSN